MFTLKNTSPLSYGIIAESSIKGTQHNKYDNVPLTLQCIDKH